MKCYLLWIPVALSCATANAVVLYSQTPDFPDRRGATSIGFGPISADNFTTSDYWSLTGATFQGAWAEDGGAVGPDNTTRQFRIELYTDNGGHPADAPFAHNSVLATMSNPSTAFDRFRIYDIAVDFPTNVLLAPQTTYWLATVDEGPGTGGAVGFFWSGSATVICEWPRKTLTNGKSFLQLRISDLL